MMLFCDNQLASNLVFHEWKKHTEVNCHFVHGKIQDKTIKTPYVCSYKQLADVLTKAFFEGVFQNMVSKLTFEDVFALV